MCVNEAGANQHAGSDDDLIDLAGYIAEGGAAANGDEPVMPDGERLGLRLLVIDRVDSTVDEHQVGTGVVDVQIGSACWPAGKAKRRSGSTGLKEASARWCHGTT